MLELSMLIVILLSMNRAAFETTPEVASASGECSWISGSYRARVSSAFRLFLDCVRPRAIPVHNVLKFCIVEIACSSFHAL